MQVLEDTSTQVKAMGQHDADSVAKINMKKKAEIKVHSMNRPGTLHADIVIEHILGKKNYALHMENHVTFAINPIILQ